MVSNDLQADPFGLYAYLRDLEYHLAFGGPAQLPSILRGRGEILIKTHQFKSLKLRSSYH